MTLFLEGTWHGLRFHQNRGGCRPRRTTGCGAAAKPDSGPDFRRHRPAHQPAINFIGGIRGTAELERLVREGEYACAFAMHPTGIGQLMAIADAGGIMPPKSTWFEPKLRDAMYCRLAG